MRLLFDQNLSRRLVAMLAVENFADAAEEALLVLPQEQEP